MTTSNFAAVEGILAASDRRDRDRASARRAKPGARGTGRFYRIEVRPRTEFVTFRTHDVGREGGVERLAGKTPRGRWLTAAWLISKDMAHIERGRLVPNSRDAQTVLRQLGAPPQHVRGDRFVAKDRPNVPERAKPTPAQLRAIRKAQTVRRKRSSGSARAQSR